MSSLGSQWRVIRHYLSITNLNAEVEKLVQKIKPATPEQWESLITRFEKAVSTRLTLSVKEIEITKSKEDKEQNVTKATTVERTDQVQPVTQDTNEVKEKPEENGKPTKDGLLVGSEAKDITLEGLWQGIKLKTDLHFGKISEPSWKSNKPVVTKTSIHSRTSFVVSSLVAAESPACLLRRTDQLIDHLHQYPEARDFAIKEGAVRALLRAQARLDEEAGGELRGALNEALALVGRAGPARGPGPNILSLDGGGIRGIIAIEILRHLERLTGRRVHQLFDYIIGVSTGAIIAAVIGSGVGSLDTASEMYQTLAHKMFGNTTRLAGTSRLVWSHSYYDTAAWEALLQEHLRDCTLSQCNRHDAPKMALVSCVVNAGGRLSPFLFRSYECGFRTRSAFPGTARAKLWHAVRASAAAPTYFDEFTLDGLVHQDGGLVVNNPAAVGVHEARLLFGAAAAEGGAVLSVGTGRAPQPARGATSWRDKFNTILDSATDTEGVHHILNDLLPSGGYYRFNPPLMSPCAMDEVAPARLAAVLADTRAYITRNRHKFSRAAAHLTRPRPLAARAVDAIKTRAILLGLTTD